MGERPLAHEPILRPEAAFAPLSLSLGFGLDLARDGFGVLGRSYRNYVVADRGQIAGIARQRADLSETLFVAKLKPDRQRAVDHAAQLSQAAVEASGHALFLPSTHRLEKTVACLLRWRRVRLIERLTPGRKLRTRGAGKRAAACFRCCIVLTGDSFCLVTQSHG